MSNIIDQPIRISAQNFIDINRVQVVEPKIYRLTSQQKKSISSATKEIYQKARKLFTAIEQHEIIFVLHGFYAKGIEQYGGAHIKKFAGLTTYYVYDYIAPLGKVLILTKNVTVIGVKEPMCYLTPNVDGQYDIQIKYPELHRTIELC